MRPLRPDKMTLAGLLATLEAYRDGLVQELLPTPAMLAATEQQLRRRARRLAGRLRRASAAPWRFSLVAVDSRVGGGALPMASPRSWAVAVEHPRQGADAVEALLRAADPPVVARIEQDRLVLDVRTLLPGQLGGLTAAVAAALGSAGG
jgi:L-seryl-tRNA(Ser) seleniumtransferase